jgi:predicted DNA-binding protein YlxM (UPF0122 family)
MTNNDITQAAFDAGKLVRAWMSFVDDPQNTDKLDRLGWEVDGEIRGKLPTRKIGGVLLGREDEICQEMLLLLFRNYFVGNKKLLEATQKNETAEIDNQLRRSISEALRIIILRLARKTSAQLKRFESLDEQKTPGSTHPSMKSFFELPFDLQRDLLLSALRIAIRRKLLGQSSVEVAEMILKEEITQSEAAKRLGISRVAVYLRLKAVREILPLLIEELEFNGSTESLNDI